jgi:2,4-dienoyl-CoA reductase (NADPH2)
VLRSITFKNKVLASIAYMAMVKHQMRRLSQGRRTQPNVPPALALLAQQVDTQLKNWSYRRWMRSAAY